MSKVWIITGPPASGKSSISCRLAEISKNGAVINVDEIRHMIKGGYVAPWIKSNNAEKQKNLAIRNACTLANNFIKAGMDVFIDDVVIKKKYLNLYKRLLKKEIKIFLLLPSRKILAVRDKKREGGNYMGGRTLDLHKKFVELSSNINWRVIDSTYLTINETIYKILESK